MLPLYVWLAASVLPGIACACTLVICKKPKQAPSPSLHLRHLLMQVLVVSSLGVLGTVTEGAEDTGSAGLPSSSSPSPLWQRTLDALAPVPLCAGLAGGCGDPEGWASILGVASAGS